MPRASAAARMLPRSCHAPSISARRGARADLRATVAFLLTLAHLNALAAPAAWWRPSAAEHLQAQALGALDVSTTLTRDDAVAATAGAPALVDRRPRETTYTARGTVQRVAGSYGTLVASVTRDGDGLVNDIVYGDAAFTTTGFSYDNRRRLSSVTTYRGPPTVRAHKLQYDDLYRVTQVDYQYASGDDTWTDPFDAENTGTDVDPRRAAPSPHVAFDKRVQRQAFQYDWLGNTSRTDDDAHGFYDRSLGTITNNTAGGKPYQLTAASNTAIAPGGARTGTLSATYDDAGNLTGLTVQRSGPCLPTGAGCSQTYAYDWDEVGRLARAERWDTATPGVNDPAAADLRYAYDANDARVLKTAVDAASNERHTLYVFATLELRRAAWDAGAEAYTRDALSEVPYLMAHGVRLARVVYEPGDKGVPEIGGSGGHTHVFFELGDHLGSTSTVLDKATGELVEKGTYQAYGGAESDYRAGRWGAFREDYRFTGKEEDAEVGLAYFGARYYAPLLGRWVSADPLTVHGVGGDLNGYAYVHGRLLGAVDPNGLDDNCRCSRPQENPDAKMTEAGTTTEENNYTPAPSDSTPAPKTGAPTSSAAIRIQALGAAVSRTPFRIASGMVVLAGRANGDVQQSTDDGGQAVLMMTPEIAATLQTIAQYTPPPPTGGEGLTSRLEGLLDVALIIGMPRGSPEAAQPTALLAESKGAVIAEASQGVQAAQTVKAEGGEAAALGDAAADVVVPHGRYPQAAAHIQDAQASGHPSVLTIDRAGADANRAVAQAGQPRVADMQLDEYPPAMFREGGAGASIRPISPRDNMGAGACIGNQCRRLPEGARVRIVVK